MINAYMVGKYHGPIDPIGAKLLTFLRARKARQALQSKTPPQTSFVMTPSAQSFTGLLQRAQYEPAMVTLTGAPGVGKTEAVRHYHRENANVWVVTASQAVSSAYGLIDALCDVMRIREGVTTRRPRAVMQALRGTGGLIILDEAHKVSMDAIDELRQFHDAPEVQVGIALVGSPELRVRMANGGKRGAYAQLTSRFAAHVLRRAPQPSDMNAILTAEGISDSRELQALRNVAMTPGGLREMKFVLRSAQMLAQDSEAAQVTLEHIEQALRQRNTEMKEIM
jgi:DNA transposition AAA+ family ATPase